MKWVPAPFWFILAPRARGWGMVFLLASAALSLVTLPLTIVQLQALFGFGQRPIRLDYLVLLWATIPWLWLAERPGPLAPAGDVAGDAGGLAFRAGAASTDSARSSASKPDRDPGREAGEDFSRRRPSAGRRHRCRRYGTTSRRRSSTGRRQIAART